MTVSSLLGDAEQLTGMGPPQTADKQAQLGVAPQAVGNGAQE